MSKGGSKTSTVQQVSEVPQYVQSAQQRLADYANNITGARLVNSPADITAGFVPDQTRAMDLARMLSENQINWGMPSLPSTVAPTPAQASPMSILTALASASPATTARYDPYLLPLAEIGQVNPGEGQVSGEQIKALLNPYTQDVIDPTIAEMRRQLGITQNQIGARGASSAAFGGSRQALQSAEANRAFGDQVARTTGELMARGYDQATATALANAQARARAGEFNVGAQNQIGMFNIGQQNQAGQINAAAQNAMNQLNSTQENAISQANAAAQNQANQFAANQANSLGQFNVGQANQMAENAANRALSTSGLANTFLNDQQRRQLQALGLLSGSGQQQQQLAQQYLNEPIDMLKLLIAATPGTTGGSSTQTSTVPTQSNILGSLGGLVSVGSGLFGAGGMFPGALAGLFGSDERDKTDIKKLGRDPGTGLDMYAYRYKGDPKTYPKVVGPMAQDIEKKYPSAVKEFAGHKAVDMNFLQAMLGIGS